MNKDNQMLKQKEDKEVKIQSQEDSLNEDIDRLYEESFKDIKVGKVIKGKIIEISNADVIIDIGYKSEGIVSRSEFTDPDEIVLGNIVEVLLEEGEDKDGLIVLSKRKAAQVKNWEKINESYEKEEVMEGKVVGKIKGGFAVDIGVEAFLPASQAFGQLRQIPQELIGKKLPFKIIKINNRRRNVVVSHRAVWEEERGEKRQKLLKEIETGQVRKGIVKNITDFGAFIDMGGVDGLLHITDITWGRISHPSEVLAVGDEVEVMILNYDKDKQRVSLGLKQKTQDPWLDIEEKYPPGSKQKGKVVNLTDYGAFVELENGVEGLVHISEMSWTKRLTHPSEALAMGDIVEGVILDINKQNRRISLGLKQLESNPWESIQEKYPVDTKIKGKIRNLTDYGAFVELEEGVDGLIHVSDMSWSGRITKPSELLKKGDKVEAVVLNIVPDKRKISLGIKQLTPDPWLNIEEKYQEENIVTGRIVKIASFGIFVELEKDIEGLIHISQIEKGPDQKLEDMFKIEQELKVKIISLDLKQRKMRLGIEGE
jgi:small subunit ribosomal protein S1